MDKYKKILFDSPRPFIIASLDNDKITISETNIEAKDYTYINIKDIETNKEIKGLVKDTITGEKINTYKNYLNDCYRIESKKIDKNEVIIWFDKEENTLDTSKMNFLSNLTHEFKTPLNLIFSSVQLMNRKIDDNTEVNKVDIKKYLNIINQNSYRILKLINNISDDSNIDLGHKEYNPTNENIVYFIEGICDSVDDFIKSNNMNLIFDTDIEELIVSFDMEKMERIILNLISNAIKFRKQDDGNIRLTICHKDDYVNIKVRDNGIGISESNLDKVFEKYVRLNDEKSIVKEGSGIGLSLVDTLVKLHSGNIYVDSCLGEWTEFTIQIPNVTIDELPEEKDYEYGLSRVEKINIEFSDIYG
ncbi:MAG: sensor histidine kinase [Peptostreptococcaceae bacterium]